MSKPLSIYHKTEVLSRIETLLEQIYDVVQEIREENSPDWLTPDMQMQLKEAQTEIERGEYKSFDNVEDLIADLHSHVHN